MKLRVGHVAILIAAAAATVAGAITIRPLAFERMHPASPWSVATTWPAHVPRVGEDVTIPAGATVVLDTAPPRLGTLRIDGTLSFADRDLRLEAKRIVVRGTFAIGDAARPFAHRARLILDGSPTGDGVLSISGGGIVALYGVPRRPWTHLAATVVPGARIVRVADDVDWRPGDRIAVAPSGFAAAETEEAVVASVAGRDVGLEGPLRFRHWGTVTSGVDERAEVGLLAHNVTIASEAGQAARGVGGQVVVGRAGRLDAHDVAFEDLGVRGKLGRYPIHFHLAGDGSSSVVADSSIVRGRNRCLTIHGTNGVLVRGNVAYAAIGHCFFLEDGAETGNVFDGNLALRTTAAPSNAILESDAAPAAYWIANPNNVLANNVAAGGDGNGFWYALSPHPTGPSTSADVWPRRTPLGIFAGNVAHANADDGLFVDILRNPPGVTEAPNYSPTITADFREFVAYKNRKRGAWIRGTNVRLSEATIADNSIGVTFAGANAILRDSRIVGTTANETGPPKPDDRGFPIRGFEFYDGRVGVERTRFANFEATAERKASALSALRFSPFFTDPTNYANALTFERATRMYFEPLRARGDRLGADGYRGVVFRDVDGSVTGSAEASVAVDTPLVARGTCRERNDWGALVCPSSFGSIFIVAVAARGASPGPVRVSLVTPGTALARASSSYDASQSMVLFGNPQPTKNAVYQTNVRSGQTYNVYFHRSFPSHLELGLHHFAPGERLTLIFPQAARDVSLARGRDGAGVAISHAPNGALVVDVSTSASTTPGANVIDLCVAGACG